DGSQVDPVDPNLTTSNRVTAEPPPQKLFRPLETPDINCWAFDDTARPGETYRYRVRYYMLNPLFSTENVAKNAEDEDVIWVVNKDDTNWSSAITTPPLTHVFLASAPA